MFVIVCVTSGKTEYQTTKANKARRSASFERRPSRRYSRRTMQNRGEDTQSHTHLNIQPIYIYLQSTLTLQI